MTSHNEVLILCLGPLAASSLGPNGQRRSKSRGTDLNFSLDPSLFFLAGLRSALRSCEYGTPNIPSAGTHGTVSAETGDWHRLLAGPGAAWQNSSLYTAATGDKELATWLTSAQLTLCWEEEDAA